MERLRISIGVIKKKNCALKANKLPIDIDVYGACSKTYNQVMESFDSSNDFSFGGNMRAITFYQNGRYKNIALKNLGHKLNFYHHKTIAKW